MEQRTVFTHYSRAILVALSVAISPCVDSLAGASAPQAVDRSHAELLSRFTREINRNEQRCPRGCYVWEVPTELIKHGAIACAVDKRDFHLTCWFYGLLPEKTVELRADDLSTFRQFILAAGVDRKPNWRSGFVSLFMEIVVRENEFYAVQDVPAVIRKLEAAHVKLATACAASIRNALSAGMDSDHVAVVRSSGASVLVDWYTVSWELELSGERTESVCNDYGFDAVVPNENSSEHLIPLKTPSKQH